MNKKMMIPLVLSLSAALPIAACGPRVIVIPATEEVSDEGSTSAQKEEDDIFMGYLKKIYSEADEYRDGQPMLVSDQRLLMDDSDEMRLYKEYSIADIDGDGDKELLILSEYGKSNYIQNPDYYEKNDKSFRTYCMVNAFEAENGQVVEKNNYFGHIATGGETLSDYIIKDNNTICKASKSDKLDYSSVGSFDLGVLKKMGFEGVGSGDYVIYRYDEDSGRIKYDVRTAWDGSDGGPITDEKYALHMNVVNSGNVIDLSPVKISAEALGVTSPETQTQAQDTSAAQVESHPEDEQILAYLKDIYNTSSEIIKGHPSELELDDSADLCSWTTYRDYAIADFDGDGRDELILHTYEPYNAGLSYGEINLYDQAYPAFDMYEVTDNGNVVNKDASYNIEGDVWMLRASNSADYSNPSLFTFYGNGVFKFELTEGGERKEAYYIFNDDIHRQLKALNHHLFKDKSIYGSTADGVLGDNELYTSALCYVTNSDGRVTRMYGSHQDNVQDELTKQEYDDEIALLTSGGVLDTDFKEFDAESLGVSARTDTLNENVKTFSISGTYREAMRLSGEIYRDETTTYGNGNSEPCTVLKLDLPFIVTINSSHYSGGQVVRIDEIQLLDEEGYDLTNVSGHHTVNGAARWGQTIHDHRSMIMEVSQIE